MENIKIDFSSFQRVSGFKLVLLILSIPIALIPVGLLVRFAPNVYRFSSTVTNGLITPTLILYLIMYYVFIYLMLIKLSGVKPIELGLDRKKLKTGFIFTLALFSILQLYGGLYSYFALGKLGINEAVKKWPAVLGIYIQLVFGVALFEEIVFRSFLIPQFFMRLNQDKSRTHKIIITVLISQCIFSLVHIPVNLINGTGLGLLAINLIGIFIIGSVLAFLYLLTGNLFICMGVHAIWDAAMVNTATLFNSQFSFAVIALVVFSTMYIRATRKVTDEGIAVIK